MKPTGRTLRSVPCVSVHVCQVGTVWMAEQSVDRRGNRSAAMKNRTWWRNDIGFWF